MIKEMLQSAIDAGKKKKQKSQPKEKIEPSKPKPIKDIELSEEQTKGIELREDSDRYLITESLEKPQPMETLPKEYSIDLNKRSRLKEKIAEIKLGKSGKKRMLAELEKQKAEYNKKNNTP